MWETVTNLHWTVQAIPIIVIGAGVMVWLLRKHKDKPPTDHILKF